MNIIKWILNFCATDINVKASHNGFQWKNYFLQKYFMRFAWIVRFFFQKEKIFIQTVVFRYCFCILSICVCIGIQSIAQWKKCAHVENKNRWFGKERKLDCDVGDDDNTVLVSFATCSVIELLSDILFEIVFRFSPKSLINGGRKGGGGFST